MLGVGSGQQVAQTDRKADMYVKVSPYKLGQEALYELETTAHYGSVVSQDPPSERDYQEEMSVSFDLLHVHGINDDPSGTEKDAPYWVYKYAWWWEGGDRLIGVVTSQRVFILSDSGKTIDRVR